MKKKVIIICYYWPPAGGPGVQRWLKFVKYLPDFDIEPIVIVPANPHYPIQDAELTKEVSSNLKIFKIPTFEPYKFAQFFSKNKTNVISKGIIRDSKKQSFIEKFLLSIRGNLFIPDARKYWKKNVVKFATDYISKNNIDAIITTGPPHSVHLIGKELKKISDVKWITDFRDPWTTIGYHKKLYLLPLAQNKHKKLEFKILNSADEIIVTSPTTKEEFSKITSKPIHLITNGYDVTAIKKPKLTSKFTIAHIGSLLSDRNPYILWEVINELMNENKLFKSQFELKLIGTISNEVLESINSYGLSNHVNNLGYISHNQALIEQRNSWVLLLIEINATITKGIIPGKIFEYMAAERPILALGPEGADIQKIIKETNSGVFCNYNQKKLLKSTLQDYFTRYQQNNLKVSSIGLQYFSRKKLTEKLVEIIKKI